MTDYFVASNLSVVVMVFSIGLCYYVPRQVIFSLQKEYLSTKNLVIFSLLLTSVILGFAVNLALQENDYLMLMMSVAWIFAITLYSMFSFRAQRLKQLQ